MNDDVISRNAVLGLLLRIKAHASVAVLYETISKETENKVVEIVDMFAEQIQSIPALDAVPVVRCKDCRYSEPMKKHGVCKFGENALNCTQSRGDDGYGYAGISVIHPDDYCSDGAPKDGEADG